MLTSLVDWIPDFVRSDLPTWMGVLLSLFAGGYAGGRAAALSRFRLEDRRELHAITVRLLDNLDYFARSAPPTNFDEQQGIKYLEGVQRTPGREPVTGDRVAQRLPFPDREGWRAVELSGVKPGVMPNGRVGYVGLAETEAAAVELEQFLLDQIRPTFLWHYRSARYRIRMRARWARRKVAGR